jgi:N-acetyl sugar amidotransferase
MTTVSNMAKQELKSVAQAGCENCLITFEDFPQLELDERGICSLCNDFKTRWEQHLHRTCERKRILDASIARVQKEGKGRPYDCVLGISGGVDSSYLAWKIHQLGLRPLAVHFDNGWNSELAVKNIESLTNALDLDLHTHVVNWPEFRDLQKAYFAASVIDIEVPTDHGIYGTLYKAALDHDVKFILGGNNIATEGFMVPFWHFHKLDHINLLDIHRRYGTNTLRSYPLFDRRVKRQVHAAGVEMLEILDLIDYSREEAVKKISSEFGWRDYGVKHGESTFTKFYQDYVLPRKFGVRKRKAHLSTLINTGELSREDAVRLYETEVQSATEMDREREYVLKKLEYSNEEFERIMNEPPREHSSFELEGSLFYEYRLLLPLRPYWQRFQSFCGLPVRGRADYIDHR